LEDREHSEDFLLLIGHSVSMHLLMVCWPVSSWMRLRSTD